MADTNKEPEQEKFLAEAASQRLADEEFTRRLLALREVWMAKLESNPHADSAPLMQAIDQSSRLLKDLTPPRPLLSRE